MNCNTQQWLLICAPESSVERPITPKSPSYCRFCFEPSTPVLTALGRNLSHDRESSQPVSVPSSGTSVLSNSDYQSPSHSSDHDSAFGNGLSPCTNSWTLGELVAKGIADYHSPFLRLRVGINDLSSSSEDLSDGTDPMMSDLSSASDAVDDEFFDDDDSFEVLSFREPPESSLFIKGRPSPISTTRHNSLFSSIEFPHTTLESQNNACSCCEASLTLPCNMPARRCFYYGKLYCPQCHTLETAHIPAKTIQSFDMRLYPVCRRAQSVLQLSFHQGIFDVQQDNEQLYQSVPILAEIKNLRMQFQHCAAYLTTCSRITEPIREKLFAEFHTREHLYQSIHLYSMSDLLSLKKVAVVLERACAQAKKHVRECEICSSKGFICEVCKKHADVLYPFDELKSIGQCSRCSNIYHRQCWDNIDHDCLRCYRIIQRQREQGLAR